MTQRALGAMLKVSPRTISAYEAGRRSPTYATLVSLSDIFGVSIDDLLDENISMIPTIDARGLTPDQVLILGYVIEQFRQANR